MRFNLTFKDGGLEKVMRSNARGRPGWERLEGLARMFDFKGNRILDIGIHGDVWPGGHAYMFEYAEYETFDIDANVIPTHVGDIREMDFPDETFDMIICHSVIEHVLKDRDKAYSEVIRVLKKGGVAVYVIPSIVDEREVEPAKHVSRTHLLNSHLGMDYDFAILEDGNMYLEVRK